MGRSAKTRPYMTMRRRLLVMMQEAGPRSAGLLKAWAKANLYTEVKLEATLRRMVNEGVVKGYMRRGGLHYGVPK